MADDEKPSELKIEVYIKPRENSWVGIGMSRGQFIVKPKRRGASSQQGLKINLLSQENEVTAYLSCIGSGSVTKVRVQGWAESRMTNFLFMEP